MGNSTSKKGDCIRALESIRDDALERWKNVSLELAAIDLQLIYKNSLPDAKVKELLKTKAELKRNKKILKSNIDMANNGLLMINQNQCDKIYEKSEKILDEFMHGFDRI